MIAATGICKFCGQSAVMEVPEDNINRIEALAKKMNIKLAEETCEER